MTLIEIVRGRCEEVGDCWMWKQATSQDGMPHIHLSGKTRMVRRVVYEAAHGSIPAGKVITPRCGHKKCVAPGCLVAVVLRSAQKAAAKRGAYSKPAKIIKSAIANRARSKYSDEVVEAVRNHDGPVRDVAHGFGMSLSHAKNIRRGTARRDFVNNPFAGLM